MRTYRAPSPSPGDHVTWCVPPGASVWTLVRSKPAFFSTASTHLLGQKCPRRLVWHQTILFCRPLGRSVSPSASRWRTAGPTCLGPVGKAQLRSTPRSALPCEPALGAGLSVPGLSDGQDLVSPLCGLGCGPPALRGFPTACPQLAGSGMRFGEVRQTETLLTA